MNIFSAAADGLAPIVVHDKDRPGAAARGERSRDGPLDLRLLHILDAKLNKFHAQRHEPFDPTGIRNDGVESRKHLPFPKKLSLTSASKGWQGRVAASDLPSLPCGPRQ